MSDNLGNSGPPSDDMSEFLQVFLDETEEQLDGLVETMLALEADSTNREDLNEAFRLIHSIKGSAGMMGFDKIALLTHHLESRFEEYRSGVEQLDEQTMNVVLRCIDYLRQCNNELRDGERLSSPTELLSELQELEEHAQTAEPAQMAKSDPLPIPDTPEDSADQLRDELGADGAIVRVVVRFRAGIQLADLKAQLIVSRLSRHGEIRSTEPALHELADLEQLDQFTVCIETQETWDTLCAAADVEGVDSIDQPLASNVIPGAPPTGSSSPHASATPDTSPPAQRLEPTVSTEPSVPAEPAAQPNVTPAATPATTQQQPLTPGPTVPENAPNKVAETMRVDIDRLDTLMNLAGELVVNRARFVQISRMISPALRKTSMLNRIRDFQDGLQRTLDSLENGSEDHLDRSEQIQQLRAGVELMDEQAGLWENGRHCFGQIGEAVDQLTRVSQSLQRGVLDTRMVPVAPLFNRFKRVVRDLSKERGKKVNLLIRGEKTELDKRMIDELGDPLVHLVRNSIDHGLEPPDVRAARGKSEEGTILLEASHRGNNVLIHIQDDGGGIDLDRIKAKLVDRQLLSLAAVAELTDAQILDFIWHPGFSTANEVTGISGRGVGMDVVKTRINILNGTIEVDSTSQQGTSFTLRLPLTLAIINGLLVRLRHTVFSIPIDDVHEIVSVEERDVVDVLGKKTFDVRGEFVPLVSIDDIFHWHGIDYGHQPTDRIRSVESSATSMDVVILHAAGKTLGLRVDELLGCQDVVIKSLAENFIHIRGLSGASILGDGSVCLMLDVGTLVDMASRPSRLAESEDVAT